jgi:sugar lactone lactonase YvrE
MRLLALAFSIFAVVAYPSEPSGRFLKLPAEAEVGPMSAVRVDRDRGLIYVLHRGGTPLLRFDAHGKYLGGWGSGLFKVPHGLRIDRDGNVWITDNGLNTVQKFSPTGSLLVTLKEANGPLRAPDDIVFTSHGDIYIADTGNSRIVHLAPDGKYIGQWGKKGKGPGEFATAHSMDIDSDDRIYVGDRNNNRIQIFTPDGTFVSEWKGFGNPFGVLYYKHHLFVAEGEIHKIFELDQRGAVANSFGSPEVLKLPHLMDYSNDGTLYVSEVDGKRVQMFALQGRLP